MTTSLTYHIKIGENEMKDIKFTPLKEAVVKQMVLMSQVTTIDPSTIELSALLHAVVGVTLMGKEKEMVMMLEPFIKELKAEAVEIIDELEKKHGKLDAEDGEAKSDPELDFFDRNEILM